MQAPINTPAFKTLAEFKAAHKANDMHFFGRKTMSFFASRIESGLITAKCGVIVHQYFITSEKTSFRDETRAFTVRRINPQFLNIDTVGDFGQYRTKEAAEAAIALLKMNPVSHLLS